MNADDNQKPEEGRRMTRKSEVAQKLVNIKSAAVSTTIFKCLQIYTSVNPHPVRDPCINAIEINRSAVDLTSCVDELTFLKEQSVAMMKQHAVLVASEFLQSGFMEESIILNLEDEEGNKLIKEEVGKAENDEDEEEEEEEEAEEEEEEEDEEETGDAEEESEYDEAAKEAEEFLRYDKIKLALARKLVDIIYEESRALIGASNIRGKLIWLERIKTILGLNKVENIYQWLDKLSEVAKTPEAVPPQHFNVWKTPTDDGLNASREHNLTTIEIWKEIQAIFLDNLEVGEALVEQMLLQHVINEHTKTRLLSLPNRKAKVRALLSHLEPMGPTVMYMFGEGLISTGQKHLGRIIIKRLDDNKIMYNISHCQNVKKTSE